MEGTISSHSQPDRRFSPAQNTPSAADGTVFSADSTVQTTQRRGRPWRPLSPLTGFTPAPPPAEPTYPRSQQEGRAPTHTAEEVSEVAQEAATLPDSLTTSAWSNTCKNRPLKNGEHREEQAFQTNVPRSLRERRRVTERDPPGSSPTQGLAGKRP